MHAAVAVVSDGMRSCCLWKCTCSLPTVSDLFVADFYFRYLSCIQSKACKLLRHSTLLQRERPSMQFKGATLVLLVLMSIITTVAPRKLLTNNTALSITLDFATEHQRILAELEEVHQLRERMLQQGETQSGWTWCTFAQRSPL